MRRYKQIVAAVILLAIFTSWTMIGSRDVEPVTGWRVLELDIILVLIIIAILARDTVKPS